MKIGDNVYHLEYDTWKNEYYVREFEIARFNNSSVRVISTSLDNPKDYSVSNDELKDWFYTPKAAYLSEIKKIDEEIDNLMIPINKLKEKKKLLQKLADENKVI